MSVFEGTELRRPAARAGLFCLFCLLLWGRVDAQAALTSPAVESEIRVDGSLSEWEGIPVLEITPASPNLTVNGKFKENDFDFRIQSRWNKQYLYLAIQWEDDILDIEDLTRKDAIWEDPLSGQRRDRMSFFDNFKFHIRESDYDYTLWISPQDGDRGPYFWGRLLMGYRGNERAGAKPMLRSESDGGKTTMEMMIVWKQLRVKPKKGLVIPLTLTISDSDLPGKFEENKLDFLKSVEWSGNLALTD